jgi:hypothetical protein
LSLPPGFTGVETEASFRARHEGHTLADITETRDYGGGHTVKTRRVRCDTCRQAILVKLEHIYAEDTKP